MSTAIKSGATKSDLKVFFAHHLLSLLLGLLATGFLLPGPVAFMSFFAIVNYGSQFLVQKVLRESVDDFGGADEIVKVYAMPTLSTFLLAWIVSHDAIV